MSPGTRPSVPRVNGRRVPWSIPTVTPFAPGNVPNRLSKVRFSLIRKTTCLMGQSVPEPPPVITTVGEDVGGAGEVGPALVDEAGAEAEPPQPATSETRAMADTAPRRPP